jgi:tetratricopeptide (TPR) repeat protein
MTLNIHTEAENLREKEQFVEALKLYEESIVQYQKDKNYLDLCDCLLGKALTYKHLFLITNDKTFAFLSKKDSESSFEIAKEFGIKEIFYRCYLSLAEAENLFNNLSKATEYYQEALNSYPRNDAEKGRFQYHLGEAQYKTGDKENGLKNLLSGLETIRQFKGQNDSFLINVWETGCLMKLAQLLKNDSPADSQKYLGEAETIISSDPRLIIRKRQLLEFKK